MARRVADVRAGLQAIAGAHPRDPLSLPVILRTSDARRTVPHRRAPPIRPAGRPTPASPAAVRRAADALADAGHEVDEAVPPTYARAIELWARAPDPGHPVRAAAARRRDGRRRPGLPRLRRHRVPADRHLRPGRCSSPSATACMRDWSAFFDTWDVLLTPTWAQPPFAHGADVGSLDEARNTLSLMRPVLPANLLGLPAAVVPAGLADGTARRRPAHRRPVRRPRGAGRGPGRRGPARHPHADRSRRPGDVTASSRSTCRAARLRRRAPAGVGRRRRGVPRRPAVCHRRPEHRSWPPWRRRASSGTTARPTSPHGRPVEPGDALVVPTSGSTGDAEGRRPHPRAPSTRPLGRRNARLGVGPDDHWLACLPLAHIGGLSVVIRAAAVGNRARRCIPGSIRRPSWPAAPRWSRWSRPRCARVDPAVFRAILLGGAAPPPDRAAQRRRRRTG